MMDLQAERGLAYLFISHDMAVVERIAHRVAVMYFGQVVEIGNRDDIFSNPQHPYTRRLIEAVPLPDPALKGTRKPAPPVEARSPIRPFDYVHVPPSYREVSPGHLVQIAAAAE
jgi:peptide/nickel transport system ATP-binding protein